MLGDELARAMAFCGATRISEIDRDLLDVDPRTGRPRP
jgi:isopentenyl diphosphate isomerase/L-lactate dehydrogenase-like FMN-dependent dehydrogenase